MTHLIKTFVVSIITLLFFSIPCTYAAEIDTYSGEIEETADMTLDGDSIITGSMNEYSSKRIIVEGIGYTLCNEIIIFNTRNRIIKLDDMETAKEVKVFANRNCVRKIIILRFGE